MRGIEPTEPEAPTTIRAAVARFFEGGKGDKIATGGFVGEWGEAETRKIANEITLCATGVRPAELNITIADSGEGQSASRMPDTILSLNKSNKMYIPFVQGQYNQGGTGALRFCGNHNLQLVISRRNPVLLDEGAWASEYEWCFTVVRRERPAGGRKNSTYTYLAPVGVGEGMNGREGGVLSFPSDSFGIFPNDEGPYKRHATYGTAIKMYDYKFIGSGQTFCAVGVFLAVSTCCSRNSLYPFGSTSTVRTNAGLTLTSAAVAQPFPACCVGSRIPPISRGAFLFRCRFSL